MTTLQKEDFDKISDETWNKLANVLTDKDAEKLNDVELAERYIWNQRRTALVSLAEWKIGYEVALAELKEFQDSKQDNAERMQLLTNQLNRAVQMVNIWKIRLQSVLKAQQDNFVLKVVAENYGNTSPAQGVKGQKEVEGLPEKSKPRKKHA